MERCQNNGVKNEGIDFFDNEGYEEEPYINKSVEPDLADDDEEDESKEQITFF